MGSVPIHMPKLFGVSFLVEILGFLAMFFIDFEYNWIFLLSGFLYFIVMFTRYRNFNARHKYETETKTKMANLRKVDHFVTKRTGLTNIEIQGANNTRVNGQSVSGKLIDSITENNIVASFIKDNTKKED